MERAASSRLGCESVLALVDGSSPDARKVAQIDNAGWPTVSQFKRHAARHPNGRWYAATKITGANGKKTKLRLPNLFLGFPVGKLVDHRDCAGLNGRHSSLRASTNALNQQNAGARGGKTKW